ncbi:MAG: gamma-butyrobetaine hydroxylase-like domain-containing protein [Reyranella sp.]|uniref:gamma-butyrobetaine hydroxylase-like domain-containing protein n=1 Tax=Reyranella sp. TaxID=1929291 RepID=UPI003D12A053
MSAEPKLPNRFPKSAPAEGGYDAETAPWPIELRLLSQEAKLEVEFSDARTFALPAEYLRVESPSAEVQGHGPSQKKIVAGKRRVTISSIEAVGHYAVRLIFDDGHDSGIFSWSYLRELGEEQAERWAAYEANLQARGLSRDP